MPFEAGLWSHSEVSDQWKNIIHGNEVLTRRGWMEVGSVVSYMMASMATKIGDKTTWKWVAETLPTISHLSTARLVYSTASHSNLFDLYPLKISSSTWLFDLPEAGRMLTKWVRKQNDVSLDTLELAKLSRSDTDHGFIFLLQALLLHPLSLDIVRHFLHYISLSILCSTHM